nr:hypothetical protein [Tanacetum cinerariifolium]
MYDVPRGLLPPVVIREPEPNKYQPLSEVPGKGKAKAGPDPGNAKESQPMPSHVVHAGSDREHIDLDVADVTPQPPPEKMDEGFTATAYPKVQENLKLTVEEQLYETLVKSMNCDHSKELAKDLAEARPSRASGSLGASGSSQVPPPPPSPPSTNEKDLQMDKDMDPDEQARSLNDEDITSAHIPKVNLRQDCKPLPLGGPPGQVTIQSNFFFNKDLKYLRYDSKGSRPAMSISKMKAAYYPKVGLEQMVPHQMWIDEECKYDIAAMYGISHWWFQRQRFYIDRHTSEGDRRAVKTHMRILSVVRIKVFSMYGDGTLQQIDEALEYQVKEFRINRINPGLNTRFWTRKHVDRSKEFMFAIQKRLKTKRIFRNLESFVDGRVRDGDYRLLKRIE